MKQVIFVRRRTKDWSPARSRMSARSCEPGALCSCGLASSGSCSPAVSIASIASATLMPAPGRKEFEMALHTDQAAAAALASIVPATVTPAAGRQAGCCTPRIRMDRVKRFLSLCWLQPSGP